jgi:hypothetical protein
MGIINFGVSAFTPWPDAALSASSWRGPREKPLENPREKPRDNPREKPLENPRENPLEKPRLVEVSPPSRRLIFPSGLGEWYRIS